ncbi:MAG: SAM-dependent methyltransferase DSY4148 (UbiE paralog) [uncultured Rubrobacteraceae bacterium]|uniref:Arsenite methyltransferase n=1 Tax=uncultured Rubrobacteraceae bacterium TaxID=349277 RepID=A0A6J4PMN3_9ACTN|nr:MAG: SAM-dependent methyltransferase DSY4148 (UbiE paralog) [uncultured Rubrobacteraceae bacterium]
MRDLVREKYAELATAVRGGDEASCCGSSCGCGSGDDVAVRVSDLSRGSYSESEKGELPLLAAEASLGCGNPVALADLSPGEVVLDLGSGGGIDVLLSARRVAPGGKAYGLDMTDEMLELARRNREEAGVENAEFLKGEIEAVPLPDAHVNVVISNCVVNLSTDKPRVISEAFRVLRPGGRFAVSDVVFLGDKGELPGEVLETVGLWTGCVVGALEKGEYEALLAAAGFEDVSVEVTNVYEPEMVEGLDTEEKRDALRKVPAASAFVRARKPEAG